MSHTNRRRVLAIGLDAAEPALIRRLIEQQQLPALDSLLQKGKCLRVQSPAHIGSGCVWPTFASGEEPSSHGIYGEWCWQADTMDLKHYAGGNFQPFWKTLSDQGISVGVLDAPFVKPIGLHKGFEVIDWGPHDPLGDGMSAHPAPIAELLTKFEPHPLSINRHDQACGNDPRALQALSAACLRGVELRGCLAQQLLSKTRPDFALIVFPEIHHCAHHLWHTTQAAAAPDELNDIDSQLVTPGLDEILHAIDQQIANLIRDMNDDDAVVVFSLHGMRPAAGVPWFLPELLCEQGFARTTDWRTQSSRERMRSVFARVKSATPDAAKKIYYQMVGPRAMTLLAGPNMLPVYHWSRTRAFSLPTDQHGWIRINLLGRERAGIVPPEEYDATCEELEAFLRGLQLEDGTPLVDAVIRTAKNSADAESSKLPDLVVHWATAASVNGANIRNSAVRIKTVSRKFTGQHARDGFCIVKAPGAACSTETVRAKDIHCLISKLLS